MERKYLLRVSVSKQVNGQTCRRTLVIKFYGENIQLAWDHARCLFISSKRGEWEWNASSMRLHRVPNDEDMSLAGQEFII